MYVCEAVVLKEQLPPALLHVRGVCRPQLVKQLHHNCSKMHSLYICPSCQWDFDLSVMFYLPDCNKLSPTFVCLWCSVPLCVSFFPPICAHCTLEIKALTISELIHYLFFVFIYTAETLCTALKSNINVSYGIVL